MAGTAQRLLLTSCALGLALAASASGSETIRLPLRVHVIDAEVREIDASERIDTQGVRDRVAEINAAFAPAGVVWELERVVIEPPRDPAPLTAAVAERRTKDRGLADLVQPHLRLAPEGFDLYVVGDLSPVGIGGAWLCGAGGEPGLGAAFVAAENARGKALATRKWAHELGHALGLGHVPCEAGNGDRLMMSGRCEHAERGRVGLSRGEIRKLRAQAQLGAPARCR